MTDDDGATDTVSQAFSVLGSTAAHYDANNDGQIDVSELGDAAADFSQGSLSIYELSEIAIAFARD